MHAYQGDRIIMPSDTAERGRVGLIREVRGADGGPPYLVEWVEESGVHEVWPPEGTVIEPIDHAVVE